jgi:integrase
VEGGSLKPATQESYRQILKHHLIPYFGGYELAQITLEEIQRFISKKVKDGKLSAQSINHLITVFKGMLKHAVRRGYLRDNPALYVERPRIPDRGMDFLTKEEIGGFLEHVPSKQYALFLAAIMTGLRQGELLAMKWRNLDWNLGQYFVKESL